MSVQVNMSENRGTERLIMLALNQELSCSLLGSHRRYLSISTSFHSSRSQWINDGPGDGANDPQMLVVEG
jgi:hypothetical protein